jgi:glycine C-acetyltransferase
VNERVILSGQNADISVSYPPGAQARKVLNFCSNNYLGLANHPTIVRAAEYV